ncbi:MAG: c-type cytochrome [Candidatus Acidiferrales bacterium]
MQILRLGSTTCIHWMAAAVSIAICVIASATLAQDKSTSAAQTTPSWAYPLIVPEQGVPSAPPDDESAPRHVPGTEAVYTLKQIHDGFNIVDWHPDDHAAMPDVVAHGRKPDMRGCGMCHLPNGQGRPESGSLAGLPASYIVEQIANFRTGVRKSAEPKLLTPTLMVGIAKDVNDAEVEAAARYFSGIAYKPWTRVVESAAAPKTHLAGGILVPVEPRVMEPLGQRIIEVPEDVERTSLHDSHSGFVAYVPIGSVKKGGELVTTGGAKVVAGKIVAGKTIQCGICHGPDLKGLGNIPRIAGSSPSYTFRQLYDFQHGARSGPDAELMKAAVANLTDDDMLSIVAYLASRTP